MKGSLLRPVEASSLGLFRILFGVLMAIEAVRLMRPGHVHEVFVRPTFHFAYEPLTFVSAMPGPVMTALFAVMGVAAAGIALGLFYRVSAAVFAASYSCYFLIDKTYFNNHYYLICLLGILLVFVDAHRWGSLDARRRNLPGWVPAWQLLLLRFQVLIVYVYGAVAKLNSDWLRAEPMRHWLGEFASVPLIGTEPAAYCFSYGGLLFDLLIGFFLLYGPTRPWAFLVALFFHCTNAWLFTIGIFPYLAIAATVLFAEPDWPRRTVLRLFRRSDLDSVAVAAAPPARSAALIFYAAWLAVQALVPLRHWLYPGPVQWTEDGYRFAWHMKLREKEADVAFAVTDRTTGRSWRVDPSEHLTPYQVYEMSKRADMMLQYARHLRDVLRREGADPVIRADVVMRLNTRPPQRYIDPTVDLASVEDGPFSASSWVLPLSTPLGIPSAPHAAGLAIAAAAIALASAVFTAKAPHFRSDVRKILNAVASGARIDVPLLSWWTATGWAVSLAAVLMASALILGPL